AGVLHFLPGIVQDHGPQIGIIGVVGPLAVPIDRFELLHQRGDRIVEVQRLRLQLLARNMQRLARHGRAPLLLFRTILYTSRALQGRHSAWPLPFDCTGASAGRARTPPMNRAVANSAAAFVSMTSRRSIRSASSKATPTIAAIR